MPTSNPYAKGIRIECHITQKCNARCVHCDAGVGYMKIRNSDMTREQMRKAVDQLIAQKVNVRRFTFCGGEPIVHPDLQGLIDEADRIPGVKLGFRVLTNGLNSTEEKRAAIRLPPRFKWIVNALDDPDDPLSGKDDPTKRPNLRYHKPFWTSPTELGLEANWDNCTVRGWCGVGLDSNGWSMCGKARMLGELHGINPCMVDGDIMQHVSTPVNDICKHCVYGLPDGGVGGKKRGRRRERGYGYSLERMHAAGTLPEVSPLYQKLMDQHKQQPLVQLERF